MKFYPQSYAIPDEPKRPFIHPGEINEMLSKAAPGADRIREIIRKSLDRNRLSMQEVAALINTTDPGLISEIKEGARKLKQAVYGERIVLFAPLYVGNHCMNDCRYCGFRASNREAVRKTLNRQEIIRNVEALEQNGQKRLVLVYGEHRRYSPEYIAETVRTVYGVKSGNGEIRRVNINAAPFDTEGFRTIREAGIGTYQIFQETYHPEAYVAFHRGGKKANYDYRLTALDRAQEAGLDDVGIGALFGLYDWRFEVMGLVRHTNHLEACYGVGPHTISFPRLQDASTGETDTDFLVTDEDFARLVAILRLAVPYAGLILTAREPENIRKEVLQYGCSQIDAGTKIEMGAYAGDFSADQNLDKEQFLINDNRSLNEVMDELLEDGYLPSFCTACYRKGRTGEHFMEFCVPGFIKQKCTPNAMLTLAEYLEDYAPAGTAGKGWQVIEEHMGRLNGSRVTPKLKERLEKVKSGDRDLCF